MAEKSEASVNIPLLPRGQDETDDRPVAVLRKGFRPFFLGAALYAAVMLPAWLMMLQGNLLMDTHWTMALWHGHEMVYGFTIAVVAGFLLTAVARWTHSETAVGGWLAAMVGLWLVGRVAVLAAPQLPGWVVAVADLAFLPAVAIAIGRCIVQAKDRRNYKFLVLLTVIWGTNLVMHLDALGVAAVEGWARPALYLSVDLVIVIALVVGGRIIPLFTRNAVEDEGIRTFKPVEWSLWGLVPAAIAARYVAPDATVTAVLNAAAGAAVLGRMVPWGALKTLKSPILWVLHVGHAWIGVGFLLYGIAIVGAVAGTVGLHAMTAGAIGTLTIGMMARVARGHTGRELKVSLPTAVAFVMVSAAAVVRVGGPIVLPTAWHNTMLVSGVLWAVAFAIYLVVFTPILTAPRPDGRPG